jgi:hypothetical protein
MRTCAAIAAWHICSLYHDSLSPVPLFVVQKKAAREAKFGTGDKVTARAARFGIPVKGTAAGACSICLHIPSAVNFVFQVFFFGFCVRICGENAVGISCSIIRFNAAAACARQT